jgi:hypothetical protein
VPRIAGQRQARKQQAAGVELTEADLVAARRRDPAAVGRIYTLFAPALFRFLAARVRIEGAVQRCLSGGH